jgi:type IV pilus assembly protein PilB
MAKLGEMLLREGLITQDQLQDALETQQRMPNYLLGDILVRKGILQESELVDVIVRQTGHRPVDLDKVELDPDLKLLVPQGMAVECRCVPFKKNKSLLCVAMVDPEDTGAINRLSSATSCTIKPFVVGPSTLERAMKRLYGKDINPGSQGNFEKEGGLSDTWNFQGMNSDVTSVEVDDRNVDDAMRAALEEVSEEEDTGQRPRRSFTDIVDIDDHERSPIIRLVNSLLSKAVQMNASDIHIEPFEDSVRVRLRIDGVLIKIVNFPTNVLSGVVSRIKVMANMDIAEKRIPQDGRLKARFNNGMTVDFRVNTLPGVYGEKVVLRVLGQGMMMNEISQLGLRSEGYRQLMEAIKNPFGMILVTGPTGSGKTTTLYTILQQLNKEDVNIVTAEDPVEYRIKGITQVNVKPAIGFTFDMALRAFLRQDPDIIMVGEIRDYETAAIAIRAALTGHLVLSSLHTNDCPSTVVRLVDMGIEPYMVASAVKLVIAQRLVRKICDNCKEEIPLSEAEKLEVDESVLASLEKLFRGKGCKKCNGLGYKGRAAVFELMPVKTQALKRIITDGGTEIQVAQVARREGLRTLRDDALEMVNTGITTLEEAIGIIMSV